MARGQQKLQSQAKAQEKQLKQKKQQGHNANMQKKAAQAALVHICTVCKAQMPDPKTYRQHFENKHPKSEIPNNLKDVPIVKFFPFFQGQLKDPMFPVIPHNPQGYYGR